MSANQDELASVGQLHKLEALIHAIYTETASFPLSQLVQNKDRMSRRDALTLIDTYAEMAKASLPVIQNKMQRLRDQHAALVHALGLVESTTAPTQTAPRATE